MNKYIFLIKKPSLLRLMVFFIFNLCSTKYSTYETVQNTCLIADLEPNYWGALYDESRRDKVLMLPDSNLVNKILKIDDWNDYEITAIKNRIIIKLNGTKTVDFTEEDLSIPQTGLIGLQVHGGGKTRVGYKNLKFEKIFRHYPKSFFVNKKLKKA